MLANCMKNNPENFKLEPASSHGPPRVYIVCSLELPALEPYVFVVLFTVGKKRAVPFHSSKAGTNGLLV